VYSLGTIIVFSLFTLLIGLGLGVLGFRRFGGQQDLQQRLQQAEQQFRAYQADVTEHFEETSRRVNTLTRSYKDVHEYLASSAMKLTNPQMSKAIAQAAQQNLPASSGLDLDNEEYIDQDKSDHASLADHKATDLSQQQSTSSVKTETLAKEPA